MNNEWFFLKEAHSLKGLPIDDIPEYIFGKIKRWKILAYKSFDKIYPC